MDERLVKDYVEKAARSLDGFDTATLERISAVLAECLKRGGKVLVCGNGGSAADASHLAGELVGRFRRERRALPVVALTADSAVLTALSNDYGYETVFSRQIEALGVCGDVLVAISTSGASSNVIAAAEEAGRRGMVVVAFTASGRQAPWSDIHWQAPSPVTSHAQEAMLVAFHALCESLENALTLE